VQYRRFVADVVWLYVFHESVRVEDAALYGITRSVSFSAFSTNILFVVSVVGLWTVFCVSIFSYCAMCVVYFPTRFWLIVWKGSSLK